MKNDRRRFTRCPILLCAVAATVAALALLWGCGEGDSGKTEPLVMAYSPFECTALAWVAEDRSFFRQNGLDVTARKYDTGVGALDGVLAGEADVAVGTNEFPLVGMAMRKAKIRTIATIDKSEFIYIVGRKDRGIEQVSDLKGKRVGTTFRTIAEFSLGRFLELNGMTMRDIVVVDLKTPAEWVDAVANGDIDAVATAQPYANRAKDRLGANATVWPAQSSQPMYALAIATDEWIDRRPDLAGKFLRALAQAEEYAARNPAEAKAIVRKRLDLDAAYMDIVWSQNRFALSLDQSLVVAMEDEARWMIENGLTDEKQVPNFLDHIHEDALRAVKPGAVNIIR